MNCSILFDHSVYKVEDISQSSQSSYAGSLNSPSALTRTPDTEPLATQHTLIWEKIRNHLASGGLDRQGLNIEQAVELLLEGSAGVQPGLLVSPHIRANL